MHIIYFIFIIALWALPLSSVGLQNLTVGETNPNEIVTLENITIDYDTIKLLNNSRLNIINSEVTVHLRLGTFDSSTLVVEDSKFTVYGVSVFVNNSTINIKDSVTFNCHMYIQNSCSFNVDSAYFYMDMEYYYQYYLSVEDNAEFNITNSTISFKKGKLGGSFLNHSINIFSNVNFLSPVTFVYRNESQSNISNCINPIEFIFHDSCLVNISDSKGFLLWFGIDSEAVVDFSFPPPTCMNGATNITSYTFSSDSVPGVSGIYYTVNISNTDTVYFATMQEENSDVTIDNPFIFGCGFNFHDGQHHVSGIYNDSTYLSLSADFDGSYINLDSSSVFTWNFYPAGLSKVFFDNSVFGEMVTYDSSTAVIHYSTCDGHGTKMGAYNHSKVYAYNSRFIRGLFFYTHPIMICKNYSFSAFYNCEIKGDFIISDLAKLYLSNSIHDHVPTVSLAAYVLDVFLDSIPDSYINSSVAITGTINDYKTFLSPDDITGYEIGYSNPDSTNYMLLGTVPVSQPVLADTLYAWNTGGLAAGNYLFWITAFVNGDSAISANRSVFLDEITGIPPTNNNCIGYSVYPNPFHDYTFFEFGNLSNLLCSVEIYDVCGRFMKEIYETEKGKIKFCSNGFNPGTYFYKLKNEDGTVGTGKLIIE